MSFIKRTPRCLRPAVAIMTADASRRIRLRIRHLVTNKTVIRGCGCHSLSKFPTPGERAARMASAKMYESGRGLPLSAPPKRFYKLFWRSITRRLVETVTHMDQCNVCKYFRIGKAMNSEVPCMRFTFDFDWKPPLTLAVLSPVS